NRQTMNTVITKQSIGKELRDYTMITIAMVSYAIGWGVLNNKIFVNGKLEKRRGKKLFINDQVLVNQDLLLKVTNYNKGK
ncbi:RNA-binding S4 domain-containing protein, partial [bacterium]|nr:RNA-binding S4 domain-containing protein [bacterium]